LLKIHVKQEILLKHYGIVKKTSPYHAFNEHSTLRPVIEKLKQGITIALVTDAGTPSISDPGFLLIRECLKQGIGVECLPGPTAFVPALVNSGIPSDRSVSKVFCLIKKDEHEGSMNLLAKDPRSFFMNLLTGWLKHWSNWPDNLEMTDRQCFKGTDENI